MVVYLIRHGQTKDYTNGIVQSPDSDLDPDYFPQLEKIRNKICLNGVIEIYSSPLKRAIQTTQILFPNLPFNIITEAYEVNAPTELIGKTMDEHSQFWSKIPAKDRYAEDWKPTGAESFQDVLKRVDSIMAFLYKKSLTVETLVLITHGNLMRHIMGRQDLGSAYSQKYFLDELKQNVTIEPGAILSFSLKSSK